VTLSTNNLRGVKTSFSPPSRNASFSSTLTIKLSSDIPTGDYSLTIYGIGADGAQHDCVYSFTVTAARENTEIIEVDNTHTFDFTNRDLPVTKVTITVTQTVFNASVSIEVFARKPAETPALDLPVYSFFDINSNINTTQIKGAIIEFKVARSWIEQNNIDVTTIRLLSLDGSWQELPTRYLDENADYMYFEAETSEFLLFTVVGKSAVPLPPPATLALPTPLWLLSVLPVGIGAGFALYYRMTWRIRPFVSLGWLRRVAMRSRWIKPVETSETEIATIIEKLKDTTNVRMVTRPIALSLKELDRTVVWKPKSRKARITKIAKRDIELFKKIQRTTKSRYSGKLSRLQ
jgi:PGF-pre-PGF domain-containing protein